MTYVVLLVLVTMLAAPRRDRGRPKEAGRSLCRFPRCSRRIVSESQRWHSLDGQGCPASAGAPEVTRPSDVRARGAVRSFR